MKITNASSSWQSFTTTKDEIIQVHAGGIVIDTDATEANRLGLILLAASPKFDSVAIGAGVTVYYRLYGATSAVFVRVPVTA